MATDTQAQSEVQRLAQTYRRESATTLKVLRAYPADQASLQPHESANPAIKLLQIFLVENTLMERALRGEMGQKREMPPIPDSWEDGIRAYEAGVARVGEILSSMPEDQFASSTVMFFTAPKTMGEYAMRDFLEFMLHDSIHHRGQLSIYLRMTGSKVPSIYGPSKDEPWN